MGKFYAVRRGKNPGIYTSWSECEAQVKGFNGARYKKFETEGQAQAFIDEDGKGDKGAGTSAEKRERSRSPVDRKPASVKVFTDGACFNIKTEQVGGVGVYWGEDDERNLCEKIKVEDKLTKNGAEIIAATRAIEKAAEEEIESVSVHTDNNYLFNCATKWIKGWRKKNWKNSSGEDVGNKREVLALDAAMDGDIAVSWVMEKGTDEMKAADKLSNEGARKKGD